MANFLEVYMWIAFMFIAITVFLFIPLYVLFVVGLFELSKRENLNTPWLSLIPIVNFYNLGMVSLKDKNISIALVVLSLLSMNVTFIDLGIITSFSFLGFMVLMYYTLYNFYKRVSDDPIVYLLISIFTLGFVVPIFVFMFRKRELKKDF